MKQLKKKSDSAAGPGIFAGKLYPLVILAAISTIVYLNILPNDFVSDDNRQVLENPWVRDITKLKDVFTSSVIGFSARDEGFNFYRPVMHIIYMADYLLFGLKPWGFHLTSIILHALNTAVFFLIVSFFISEGCWKTKLPDRFRYLPPFAAALWFSTNTINTESVAWVACIPELSYTLFYLLSFYMYARSGNVPLSPYYLLSLVFFLLASFSKETALTLPVFLLSYDFFVKGDIDAKTPLKEWARRYLPYFIIIGFYLFMRVYALRGFAPRSPAHPELDTFHYLINVLPLLGKYFYKIALPVNLNIFHDLDPALTISDLRFMISAVFLVFLLAGVFFLRRVFSLASFSIIWIIIPLLPVLYIPFVGENTFAERYAYLPSAGFSLLVAIALFRLPEKGVVKNTSSIILIIILVSALYSIGTISRNRVWKGDLAMAMDMVEKTPGSSRAYYSLGLAYYRKGMLDEAIKGYERAFELKSFHLRIYRPYWHYDLALAYHDKGLLDEAISHYKEAIRWGLQNDPDTHTNLGNAYAKKGLLDDAVREYREALKIDPKNELAARNLGVVIKRME